MCCLLWSVPGWGVSAFSSAAGLDLDASLGATSGKGLGTAQVSCTVPSMIELQPSAWAKLLCTSCLD